VIGRKREPEQQVGVGVIRAATSFIANGTRITGDCVTTGELRIEGHVTGNVRAAVLVLTPTGRVDGDVEGPDQEEQPFVVHGTVRGAVRARRVEVGGEGQIEQGLFAEEATVQGRVSGGVVARARLILEETGVVEGDVRARRLALKEGGMVNGDIRMGDRADTGENALEKQRRDAAAAG
jgi:cytoskeletal protein CcmA (bactofilin family)